MYVYIHLLKQAFGMHSYMCKYMVGYVVSRFMISKYCKLSQHGKIVKANYNDRKR